jgi:hypothetical protein
MALTDVLHFDQHSLLCKYESYRNEPADSHDEPQSTPQAGISPYRVRRE